MGLLSPIPAPASPDAPEGGKGDVRPLDPARLPRPRARSVAPVVIIASDAEITPLKHAFGRTFPLSPITLAMNANEAIPSGALNGTEVLVIEVDMAWPGSVQRLREVRHGSPGLPIVAAIRGASVALIGALVREGIADVVALPFDCDELERVTRDVIARRFSGAGSPRRVAPLVSVVGSIGGCGATTIATHLAADLGARAAAQGGAVLADLDVQFGTASDYLKLAPHRRLTDLLHADSRLDEELMRSVATAAGPHLSVIAAPDTIMPLEGIDTDQLHKVIALMRQQFGFVVLDLPSDWTNWTLSVAMESSLILVVVEQSLRSLRQARRRLELFRSVGIADSAVAVVTNRVKNGIFGSIRLHDVAEALGHPVLGSICLERPHICLAQDKGTLVSAIRKKSRFVSDIARLGGLLCEGALAETA